MKELAAQIVLIAKEHIKRHENSDSLSIVDINNEHGWYVVVKTEEYKEILRTGLPETRVFVPIGLRLPPDPRWGFLETRKWKVCSIRLRQVWSQGVLLPVYDPTWKVGEDVTEKLGAKPIQDSQVITQIPHILTKWEKIQQKFYTFIFRYFGIKFGKRKQRNPFHYETEIGRIQNYKGFFTQYETDRSEWVYTEKCHGTNSRFLVQKRWFGYTYYVASHRAIKNPAQNGWWQNAGRKKNLSYRMKSYAKKYGLKSFTLYGEIYGPGIQNLTYGVKEQEFILFDAEINKQFANWDALTKIAIELGLTIPPIFYRGPLIIDKLYNYADGPTILGNKMHIREGIVARNCKETPTPGVKGNRCWFKVIGREFDSKSWQFENDNPIMEN